jgi:arylsulfatase A-like enzyme
MEGRNRMVKDMKTLQRALLGLAAAISLGLAPALPAQPPNIVVLLADDLGYGDVGAYGATHLSTPHLDRLAAQGARLTSFYANAPVCTPTRAAFLTGRYPQRPGGLETAIGLGNAGRYDDAVRLAELGELGLPTSFAVLPASLKQAGYRSALIGKWHLGYETKFLPRAHGWDFSIGPLGGGVDYFHHSEPVGLMLGHELTGAHDLFRNGTPHFREGYYMTRLLTDEAVAWLNQQRDGRPFLLYVPYTAPHTPYQGPGDYRPNKMQQDDWNTGSRETYAAMVASLDRGVGSILDKLDEMGLADNTVVIFFSDNGPTRLGSAGPFSGNKGGLLEGGIRVPCIIRRPGRIRAGLVSDQMAISMDLTASILRLAGVTTERPLDGIDIIDRLETEAREYPRTLFWRTRRLGTDLRAVRDAEMKYLYNQAATGMTRESLFDLSSDPGERHNLIEEKPEIAVRLKGLLEAWMAEVASFSR